jgi:hypothetical protein
MVQKGFKQPLETLFVHIPIGMKVKMYVKIVSE